jgi:hypothetical protein
LCYMPRPSHQCKECRKYFQTSDVTCRISHPSDIVASFTVCYYFLGGHCL